MSQSKSDHTRQRLALLVRSLFAVGIFAGLFAVAGTQDLVSTFSSVRWDYVVLLVSFSAVLIWASCLKWRLFVRASGRDVSLLHLMKLYTVGYFFNTFTPSYVGGDLARSFHLGRHLESQRDAFVATFLERFTGLLAMALLGALFVVCGAEVTAGLSVAILSVGAGAAVLGAACFMPRFSAWCFAVVRRVLPERDRGVFRKLHKVLNALDEGLQAARGKKKLLFDALVLSLFFHFLTVVNTYIAAKAVGWDTADIGGLFVVVPLVLLVSMVPLTPNGLGIQEGAFLFLLKRIGADEAQGLAVGLLLRAKVILLAMIGALLWARLKKIEPQ
ncbi:MAG: flippase-like domain-containing protein [Bdellovibrionales bacterium]|nr:flippase-like domain-containing protein [Bdellovibrionales bacterium]